VRAAAVTFFGIQAQAIAMVQAHLRIPGKLSPGVVASDYVAALLSGVAFPLHRIITIVLWNT
jgi:hypothetical protein